MRIGKGENSKSMIRVVNLSGNRVCGYGSHVISLKEVNPQIPSNKVEIENGEKKPICSERVA